MKEITSRWPHQKQIKVEWNLGKRCNLDCAYCPAEIHDNFSPHTDIEVLKSAVDKLASLKRPVRVSFTGGEPCVHPQFEELAEYAASKLNWVSVTTNGTRPPSWYLKLPVNYMVFSMHFDNKVASRVTDCIIEYGHEATNKFHVNLMAHHEHMNQVRRTATLFDVAGVPYTVRRIRWTEKHDWFDDLRYHHEDLNWILNQDTTAEPNVIVDKNTYRHANDIIKNNENAFEGWKCKAGVESLMINWDGEVHRATCRVGGSLGNIYHGTFEQPAEAVICTRKWCTCAADIPLSKNNY